MTLEAELIGAARIHKHRGRVQSGRSRGSRDRYPDVDGNGGSNAERDADGTPSPLG